MKINQPNPFFCLSLQLGVSGANRKWTRPAVSALFQQSYMFCPPDGSSWAPSATGTGPSNWESEAADEEWPYDDRDEDYNPGAGKDDMQEDETMSSEASEEESHSASGGVGVDEEVSDSSNNNTMREEDRSRLKAPTQPFPPLLYINIPYSQVFFQFLPHVIS